MDLGSHQSKSIPVKQESGLSKIARNLGPFSVKTETLPLHTQTTTFCTEALTSTVTLPKVSCIPSTAPLSLWLARKEEARASRLPGKAPTWVSLFLRALPVPQSAGKAVEAVSLFLPLALHPSPAGTAAGEGDTRGSSARAPPPHAASAGAAAAPQLQNVLTSAAGPLPAHGALSGKGPAAIVGRIGCLHVFISL